MRKTVVAIALVAVLLVPLAGCDFWIYQIDPTPTAAPPAPPGTACSVLTRERLQSWLNEKVPRTEREVPGGVVYFDTPRVTNCDANTGYFQVRVGFEGQGLVIELGLFEQSLNLRYDAEQGTVCVDLIGYLAEKPLSAGGVEQVGQEIKVAEARSSISGSSLDAMPAATRQQFDQAVNQKAIAGGDPESQGIGTEAANVLLDWAVGDLIARLNAALAKLLGACLTLP